MGTDELSLPPTPPPVTQRRFVWVLYADTRLQNSISGRKAQRERYLLLHLSLHARSYRRRFYRVHFREDGGGNALVYRDLRFPRRVLYKTQLTDQYLKWLRSLLTSPGLLPHNVLEFSGFSASPIRLQRSASEAWVHGIVPSSEVFLGFFAVDGGGWFSESLRFDIATVRVL